MKGERKEKMGKDTAKKIRYTREICRRMYLYFLQYEDRGAPSIAKFAKSIGSTVAELEGLRKNKRFDRAYRECEQIRRDYLIDRALDKRFDPSFVKFLLTESESDNAVGDFRLQVEVDE